MMTGQSDVDQSRAVSVFSQKELAVLWNRMRTARKRALAMVQTSWGKVATLDPRVGKNEAKRSMLFLWLQDPKWGKQTLEEFAALVDTDTRGQREMWVTFGRLEVLCGSAEAKTMIENNELESRDHPSRPNAKLYKWVEEWREQTRRAEHGRRARQTKDISDADEFSQYKSELMTETVPYAKALPLQDAVSGFTPLATVPSKNKATSSNADVDDGATLGVGDEDGAASEKRSQSAPSAKAKGKAKDPRAGLVKKATSMMAQAARYAMALGAEATRLLSDPLEHARSKRASEMAAKWEQKDKDLRAMVKRSATDEITAYAETFAKEAEEAKRFLKKRRTA